MNVSLLIFATFVLTLNCISAHADLMRLETASKLRGVYFLPTPNSPKIIVHPVIVAGEADFDGPEGLSHYLEHLMFWHADKINDKPYHGRGGNAWVNGYITSYINSGSKAELNDMFAFAYRLLTPPTLDEKFMLDERDVVIREYDYRVSENPDRRARTIIWSKLLPDNPVARSVIGTPLSIGSLNLDHARSFHNAHYVPANTVLLVAGNIKPEDVIAQVNRVFGELPAGQRNEQKWRREAHSGTLNETMILQDRYVAFPALIRAASANWVGTSNKLADMAVLELATKLMGSALEGSLSKPLRIDNFIFSGYSVEFFSLIKGQAQYFFSGRLDEGVTHQSADAALLNAMSAIADKGVPEASVNRVRKRVIRAMRRKIDDARHMLNLATTDLSFGVMPQSTAERIRRLEAVTAAQINNLLRAVVKAERKITVNLVTKEN